MTARQAEIVKLLKRESPIAVAKRLGLAPNTVYSVVREVRRQRPTRLIGVNMRQYFKAGDPLETMEHGAARRDREIAEGKRCGAPCWLIGPHEVCLRGGRS